jgi:hypothetical protein
MKTKKLSKKLFVSKQTVSNLSGKQLKGIKGGITGGVPSCIGPTCADEGCTNWPCQTAGCSGRETCDLTCFC